MSQIRIDFSRCILDVVLLMLWEWLTMRLLSIWSLSNQNKSSKLQKNDYESPQLSAYDSQLFRYLITCGCDWDFFSTLWDRLKEIELVRIAINEIRCENMNRKNKKLQQSHDDRDKRFFAVLVWDFLLPLIARLHLHVKCWMICESKHRAVKSIIWKSVKKWWMDEQIGNARIAGEFKMRTCSLVRL